jgi:hypothetical protein
MPIDFVHREPRSAFAGKMPDDFGVGWPRSGRTSDPVIDRGGADVELYGEELHSVGPNEARELGFPSLLDFPAHQPPYLLRLTNCSNGSCRG